jgi:DMSO reductase anchor subunit
MLAYAGRLASLARNARLRPKSTLATAIGVKHPRIAQIAQGAMGGSFNTREFFHGRTPATLQTMRWAFLLLAFAAPLVLLALALAGAGGSSVSGGLAALAVVVQFAGLLAERWYFFAEARHPQNLYYQAVA